MEENKRERWKKAVLPERDTKMGFYLNSRAPYVLYEGETKSRYFIDKTLMLEKIFGFIEEEVDGLYEKYLADTVNPKIGRDDLKVWYDGYYTKSGERIYNPRSVVLALSNNNLGNYWTNSGPYDEI
ncbi:AAA family ATPase [Dorea longicatena]|uniref:AAA family ATPase n=1 Tax=Dorea longicatena TaxID=88431 RepID=UPI0032C0EEBF